MHVGVPFAVSLGRARASVPARAAVVGVDVEVDAAVVAANGAGGAEARTVARSPGRPRTCPAAAAVEQVVARSSRSRRRRDRVAVAVERLARELACARLAAPHRVRRLAFGPAHPRGVARRLGGTHLFPHAPQLSMSLCGSCTGLALREAVRATARALPAQLAVLADVAAATAVLRVVAGVDLAAVGRVVVAVGRERVACNHALGVGAHRRCVERGRLVRARVPTRSAVGDVATRVRRALSVVARARCPGRRAVVRDAYVERRRRGGIGREKGRNRTSCPTRRILAHAAWRVSAASVLETTRAARRRAFIGDSNRAFARAEPLRQSLRSRGISRSRPHPARPLTVSGRIESLSHGGRSLQAAS